MIRARCINVRRQTLGHLRDKNDSDTRVGVPKIHGIMQRPLKGLFFVNGPLPLHSRNFTCLEKTAKVQKHAHIREAVCTACIKEALATKDLAIELLDDGLELDAFRVWMLFLKPTVPVSQTAIQSKAVIERAQRFAQGYRRRFVQGGVEHTRDRHDGDEPVRVGEKREETRKYGGDAKREVGQRSDPKGPRVCFDSLQLFKAHEGLFW